MNNIVKVSLDTISYQHKPNDYDIKLINNRLIKSKAEISIERLADLVGNKGCTFAPAIFGKKRTSDEVLEIQLLCLDFDNKDKKISINEAIARSESLDLPVAFAYETFSSNNCSKFRIVYRYFEPIVNMDFYKIMIGILLELFPEADKATKDPSRIFYGGKGLITEVSTNVVTPDRLFNALSQYYSSNNKEKVERIKDFCIRYRIGTKNKTFDACTVIYDGKSLDTPILYNKRDEKLFPNEELFVIRLADAKNSVGNDKKVRYSNEQIKHITGDDLYNNCKLIMDCKNGTYWLHYPELWGMLTNLVHISGGIKYFRNMMNNLQDNCTYDYNYTKWDMNCTQISKCPYVPECCDNFCPYANECKHGKNIIATVKATKKEIITLDNAVEYTDINTARTELYHYMKNAVSANNNSIYLINAQTGLGKTENYIRCMQESNKKFIIAVPTNDLKDEVLKRIKAAGIDAVSTPALPDDIEDSEKTELEACYRKGDLYSYRAVMKKLNKKYESIRQFNKNLRQTMKYDGNIVTTHFRLVYQFNADVLGTHTIIADEDILQTVFHTDSVSINKINTLIGRSYIPRIVKGRLKYYRKSIQKAYKNLNRVDPLCIDTIKFDLSKDSIVDFDLENLLNAKSIVADNCTLYYSWLKELPQQKIIILSATANYKVYAAFFKNRHVEEYNVKEVLYKGKVIQQTEQSYSRKWIAENTDKYEKIRKQHNDCYEICFKIFEDDNTDLHYGNTQGKDGYSDKNLLILGTPFPNDRVCRLMAAAMDYNAEIINKDSINFREVIYDRYKFYFSTFEDELLKEIHIYHIVSELEQAIGRARLLNNDNTVYVYSSFPAKQATFNHSS